MKVPYTFKQETDVALKHAILEPKFSSDKIMYINDAIFMLIHYKYHVSV